MLLIVLSSPLFINPGIFCARVYKTVRGGSFLKGMKTKEREEIYGFKQPYHGIIGTAVYISL